MKDIDSNKTKINFHKNLVSYFNVEEKKMKHQ